MQEKGLSGGMSGRQVDPDGLPAEWYNCELHPMDWSCLASPWPAMRRMASPLAARCCISGAACAGLHWIQDEPPVHETRAWKPIYHLRMEDNLTGTPRQALPKGSWYNPSQVGTLLFAAHIVSTLSRDCLVN